MGIKDHAPRLGGLYFLHHYLCDELRDDDDDDDDAVIEELFGIEAVSASDRVLVFSSLFDALHMAIIGYDKYSPDGKISPDLVYTCDQDMMDLIWK